MHFIVRVVLFALIVAVYSGAWAYDNLELGTPGGDVQVVDRVGYALGFSKKHKQPLWVAYRLTANEVTNAVVHRADKFVVDDAIEGGSATLAGQCV